MRPYYVTPKSITASVFSDFEMTPDNQCRTSCLFNHERNRQIDLFENGVEETKRFVLALEQRMMAKKMMDQGESVYKIAEEYGVGKMQIQNLRNRKSELLNDFKNDVLSETKHRCYLTGNEEINDPTDEWFKDTNTRRIIITGTLLQEKALDFAKRLNKGGYLDFSHLTELKNTYRSITEIYMKKQYKSSRIKNHKIIKKKSFDGVPLKGYVAS